MNNKRNSLIKYKSCLICGCNEFFPLLSSEDKYIDSKKKYYILSCNECGYCFTYLPSDIDPISFYPKDYRQLKKGVSNLQKAIYLVYYSLLFPYKWFPEGVEILDVGCGNGLLSFFLKNKGFNITCIERNKESAAFAAEAFGLDVKNCELQDASFPNKRFDVAIFRHSLEHIADILSTLEEAKRILKDDGLIFIESPNIKSSECKIFGSSFYHLDLPRHLHHFCPDSLDSLMDKHNFEVKSLGYDNFMPHTYSMSFIFAFEKLIHKRIPCIIRRIICIIIYPLSLVISISASFSGKGSIIRLLAISKGE